MDRGYVRIWRKSVDSGWLKNHKLWAFWSYCLLKATHKEHDVIVGYQTVHLIPGQFIFGRKKASLDTGLSEQEIRTCINLLKKTENLTIKSTNKYSIITIINWGIYQNSENEINQQINTPVTSKQPATNQQITTYKNGNNEKNIQKRKTSIPDNFEISDRVRKWAEEKHITKIERHLESFKLLCSAKNYQYVDWDSAFMNAVRNNWAKVETDRGPERRRYDELKTIPCPSCGKPVLEMNLISNQCPGCFGR
jgi:hypothetical protein